MRTPQLYKGHRISLKPEQLMNQTWGCQYVIVEFARREFRMLDMSNLSGYAWGAFATRQKAEAAALVKAKALIDKFRFTDDL